MKKISALLCMLLMVSVLLVGCGDDNSSSNASTAGGTSSTTSTATATDDKLDSFVEEMGSAVGSMFAGFEEMMDINLLARDGAFVMSLKYKMDIGDIDAAKTQLEVGTDALAESMQDMLDAMTEYGVENPVIVIEYINVDDTMIYTTEIK